MLVAWNITKRRPRGEFFSHWRLGIWGSTNDVAIVKGPEESMGDMEAVVKFLTRAQKNIGWNDQKNCSVSR